MAILIDANFPGGGLENARIVQENSIYYTAPVDGSLTNRTMWFAFRVCGAKGKALTFIQEKMERTLEVNIYGTYGVVRPVVREGTSGEWKRISKEDIVYDPQTLYFSFHYTPQSDETYIAFCYPYQLSDLMNWVKKYEDNPYLKVQTLCKTLENRDYPILMIGDYESDTPKDLILLSARQHAGETPSSYVLEGLLSRLLSTDTIGSKLLEKAVFLVMPLGNLDGVEEGRYGKDAPPVDFNRDWRYDATREEIRCILSLIDELSKKHRMALRFDFHGPHPGGPSHLVPGRYSVLGEEKWNRACRMRRYVETLFEPFSACRVEDLEDIYFCWAQENYMFNQTAYLSNLYGAEGFTLECAYNQDRLGRELCPSVWNQMGHTFAQAIYDNYYNPDFSYEDDIPNLELCWPDWTMVCLPENIEMIPNGRTMVLKAQKQYDRLIRSFDGFVTDKHEMTSGAYTLTCHGKAKLKIFAYYFRDGRGATRSNAFDLLLENETIDIPFEWLQAGTQYQSLRAGFRTTYLEGMLTIVHHK